jgi:hypothetical protein
MPTGKKFPESLVNPSLSKSTSTIISFLSQIELDDHKFQPMLRILIRGSGIPDPVLF